VISDISRGAGSRPCSGPFGRRRVRGPEKRSPPAHHRLPGFRPWTAAWTSANWPDTGYRAWLRGRPGRGDGRGGPVFYRVATTARSRSSIGPPVRPSPWWSFFPARPRGGHTARGRPGRGGGGPGRGPAHKKSFLTPCA
jgi:hypothetical protein